MSMLKAIANYKSQIALPAISGGNIKALFKTIRQGKVSTQYYGRVIASFFMSALTEPFRIIERMRFNQTLDSKPLNQPPVFIIGHWRSGTTHLHNFIGKDPRMGYVSTYHSVFPEMLFVQPARFIFESFMRFALPKKRQGDNVVMNADFPQEEEFALGNIHALCYYNFWYFPSRTLDYYKRYIDFEGIRPSELNIWKTEYGRLIKKALLNTKGEQFVSKNPPNTGRIKLLLEMFPNARFIHIYRNPVEVFLSTKKFITSMMPSLQLETMNDQLITDNIFEVYKKIMTKYLNTRSLIPKGQLSEVCFETFEQNPTEELHRIYTELSLPGFEQAAPKFAKYATKEKSYQKNRFLIDSNILNRILDEWGFAMNEWGYQVPAHIEVKQETDTLPETLSHSNR
ncbi:MAG: sulfotransferase [Sphingobacteriales bacterium]|nr:MAG: sulfotransferase [Sphingobacteriales bacterium]